MAREVRLIPIRKGKLHLLETSVVVVTLLIASQVAQNELGILMPLALLIQAVSTTIDSGPLKPGRFAKNALLVLPFALALFVFFGVVFHILSRSTGGTVLLSYFELSYLSVALVLGPGQAALRGQILPLLKSSLFVLILSTLILLAILPANEIQMYVFILSLAIAMAPGLATLEIPGRLQTPIIAFTMSVVLVLISTLYTVTLIPLPVVRCDGKGLIGKGFPLLWYYAITPYPGIYYCPQITAQPAALPNGSMAFLIDSGFYA